MVARFLAKAFDRRHRFCIVIGPLDIEPYHDFTPRGGDLLRLVQLVAGLYALNRLGAGVADQAAECAAALLGHVAQLGWSSWLGEWPTSDPVTGMRFEPERYQTACGARSDAKGLRSKRSALSTTCMSFGSSGHPTSFPTIDPHETVRASTDGKRSARRCRSQTSQVSLIRAILWARFIHRKCSYPCGQVLANRRQLLERTSDFSADTANSALRRSERSFHRRRPAATPARRGNSLWPSTRAEAAVGFRVSVERPTRPVDAQNVDAATMPATAVRARNSPTHNGVADAPFSTA